MAGFKDSVLSAALYCHSKRWLEWLSALKGQFNARVSGQLVLRHIVAANLLNCRSRIMYSSVLFSVVSPPTHTHLFLEKIKNVEGSTSII